MSGIIGGPAGYHILRRLAPDEGSVTSKRCDGSAYSGRSKLEALLGPEIWKMISGRIVVDFGCGEGETATRWRGMGPRL